MFFLNYIYTLKNIIYLAHPAPIFGVAFWPFGVGLMETEPSNEVIEEIEEMQKARQKSRGLLEPKPLQAMAPSIC